MHAFIKSQCSSFIATMVDFSVTILLTEACGLWYLFSTSTGSVVGGITNFIINRRWVFKATEGKRSWQAVRYFLVWSGSILFNISGVYLLTNFGHINYVVSKVITAVMVGIFFNFLLFKKFVFNTSREIKNSSI
ncbi:MAG: GtrA family protein [Bacteroidales bacterium]|nr:GtrA family protein [Bacteroidales bacterium]MDD4602642.1 GtrA family protein [Bacteroidales bacterium]